MEKTADKKPVSAPVAAIARVKLTRAVRHAGCRWVAGDVLVVEAVQAKRWQELGFAVPAEALE
jgi:hypothetical protein